MKLINGAWSIALASASLLWITVPAVAQSDCVSWDTSTGWGVFVNRCSTGVDIQFTDQGSCNGWQCSLYVSANGRNAAGNLKGRISWFYCMSPGGIGDVVADCDAGGNCQCKD